MSTSPNRMLGIILGLIYVVIGVVGFFYTSATDFASTQGPLFIGLFEVNPLQNLIHLGLGIALLICGLVGVRSARVANLLAGLVFAGAGVLGLGLLAAPTANIFAFNGAADVLHFASAVVLLTVAIGADREAPKPKVS